MPARVQKGLGKVNELLVDKCGSHSNEGIPCGESARGLVVQSARVFLLIIWMSKNHNSLIRARI